MKRLLTLVLLIVIGLPAATAQTVNDTNYVPNLAVAGAASADSISSYGFVNIRKYGATGDGVTDDFLSVTNALNALPSSGGILFIPPGNYLMSNSLSLTKAVTILGCGAGMSRRFTNSPICSVSQFLFTNPSSYGIDIATNVAEVRNLQLYFTNTVLPSAGSMITVSTNSGDTNGWTRFLIDSVGIDGGYGGISMRCGATWIIHGCNIQRWNGLDGILIDNIFATHDWGDWCISDTTIMNTGWTNRSGIRIEGCGGGKIVNTKINSLGIPGLNDTGILTNGIDIFAAAGVTTGILLINNCSIEGFSQNGIYSAGTGGTFVELGIDNCQFGVWSTFEPAAPVSINLNNGIGDPCVINNVIVDGSRYPTYSVQLRGMTNSSVGLVQTTAGITTNPVYSDNPLGFGRSYLNLLNDTSAAAVQMGKWLFPNISSSSGLGYINMGTAESTGNAFQIVFENHGNNSADNAGIFNFYGVVDPIFRITRAGNAKVTGSMTASSGVVTNYINFGGTVSTNQLYAVGTNLFWNGKQVTVAP